MLLIILSVIDIIAAGALSLCEVFPYTGSGLIAGLGIFLVLKGAWSILTAAAAGFYMDVIGGIDLVCGILLWTTTLGISLHLFVYLGIALLLKGLYSLIVGLSWGK